MSVLKYVLIAGGVAFGVVLVRRALQPPTVAKPQSPIAEILGGVANLASVIKGPAPATHESSDKLALSASGGVVDSATARSAAFRPSPIGALAPSPYAVNTSPLVLDSSAPMLAQPTAFSSPAQRSIAGVSTQSLFGISTNIARR